MPRMWMALGVLLIAAGAGADAAGLSAGRGLGPRELAAILLGSCLIAGQVWRTATGLRPRQCIGIWVWGGLSCGALDALAIGYAKLAKSSITHITPDYPWLLPTSCTLLFTAAGTLAALALRLRPGLLTLPVAVFACVTVLAWSLAQHVPRVHDLSECALAVGFATLTAKLAAARPFWFVRMCRVTSVGMAALVIIAFASVSIADRVAESRRLAALPPPPKNAPNVLLVVLDTLRADRLGLHGHERETSKELDAFAASGVVFDRAITTSPWTLPSHASMFSGRFPHEMSASWVVDLDDRHPTLAQALSDVGYLTAGFVGNLYFCSRETGLARGFSHYEDYPVNAGVMLGSPTLGREILDRSSGNPYFGLIRNDADAVTDRFLGWLGDRDDERPFFAFLNYYDVHAILQPRGEYASMFGPASDRLADFYRVLRWSKFSDEVAQGFLDAYDGCIAFMDFHLGRLFDELERRGVLDDTVVLVTADHGELFGEHNLKGHGNSLYSPLLHAPLIVRYPAVVPAGVRVSELVSLSDLPATVFDLLGVQPPEPFPGHSLAPLWSGDADTAPRSPALSAVGKVQGRPAFMPVSKGDLTSLFLDGLHYIENSGGGEELYDVGVDPRAENNLIETRPADADRLRQALQRALAGKR